jgi:hypothetical protein
MKLSQLLGIRFRSIVSTVLFVWLSLVSMGWAQSIPQAAPCPLLIDATSPVQLLGHSSYTVGTSLAPDGESITLNNRYLLFNGKPWLPVMGEFHYTRVPEERWQEELLKMKADGVQIISTYVFWIHHEEVEGQFDWSGRRDLRHFVELCAKDGLYLQVRIGPWCHGEVRNGGFPDWLVKEVAPNDLRTNSPTYMSYVQKYYDQIGQQVKGFLWKDGGPIIGVQLENEYAMRGPHAGEEYILALKKLAIQAGLDVPLYIVTGWDNAVVPERAVLPVYGGYMDAPWDGSTEQLPPSEVYVFRFRSRVSGNMGMMGARNPEASTDALLTNADTPFLTAEMGGGMQDTYHRRPVIEANDVASIYPVMLGSGVNMYGIYMFQGGENPEGKQTTLQESQATGYPNDVPVKSYDFGAPLGEFGQERGSFHDLKIFNYFLNDFGDLLAPLTVRSPELLPKTPSDFSVPRISVRTNGTDGFVFWNNYLRYYSMPAWTGVQVEVELPYEVINIPRKPISVPSGAYFIWPFNLDLSGIKLKYSTAQLFTKLTLDGIDTYFFVAIPGIASEFAFDGTTAAAVKSKRGRIVEENGTPYATDIKPGLTPGIILKSKSGAVVHIFLLSKEEAESAWKVEVDGSEHMLFTSQQFFSDSSHIYLRSIGSRKFNFQLLPEVSHGMTGSRTIHAGSKVDGLASFTATVPKQELQLRFKKIQDAGHVAPVKLGPQVSWRKNAVAEAPEDGAFNEAGKWLVIVPMDLPTELSDVFLEARYMGDVARLYSSGRFLEDDFYNGQPWDIGLDRFKHELQTAPLELDILPLRKDAPIFLEKQYWPQFPKGDQMADLQSLKLIPEYQLSIDIGR